MIRTVMQAVNNDLEASDTIFEIEHILFRNIVR